MQHLTVEKLTCVQLCSQLQLIAVQQRLSKACVETATLPVTYQLQQPGFCCQDTVQALVPAVEPLQLRGTEICGEACNVSLCITAVAPLRVQKL